MKRILFIDRDGVLLQEPVGDLQVDSVEKTRFVPGVITVLANIAAEFDFYKVMVSNQDGTTIAIYRGHCRTIKGEILPGMTVAN